MIERNVKDHEEINTFLRDEKELFFTNLVIAIQTAWEDGYSIVDIAKFHITETGTTLDISIGNEDWRQSLYLGLYHFEEVENYEYCEEIKDIITKMYGE